MFLYMYTTTIFPVHNDHFSWISLEVGCAQNHSQTHIGTALLLDTTYNKTKVHIAERS